MKKKHILLTFILSSLLSAGLLLINSDTAPKVQAQTNTPKIDGFSLADTQGKIKTYADLKGKSATVLMFVSGVCAVDKGYGRRINDLAKEYAARGVSVTGLISDYDGKPDQIKQTAAQYNFPVLIDKDNVVADKIGATMTPGFFLVNSKDEVVYEGYFDSETNGGNITEKNLREALDAVLAGKPIAKSKTSGFACTIYRGESSGKKADTSTKTAGDSSRPPNMALICLSIATLDSESFDRLMNEAAGVKQGDNEAQIKNKFQKLWNKHDFICNVDSMNRTDANIGKFAVKIRFKKFLETAVYDWELNLNKIDRGDSGSILDYLDSERIKTNSPGVINTLNDYREILIEGGAKNFDKSVYQRP